MYNIKMKLLSKFTAFLKAHLASATTYPGMMIIWMFEIFFLPFGSMLIWIKIASDNSVLANSKEQIIGYYLVLPLISMLTASWHGVFMAEDIRTGAINKLLTKPISPLLEPVTNNLSEKAVKIIFLTPFVLISFLLFPQTYTFTGLKMLTFILVFVLAFVLTFAIETFIGASSFWLEEVNSMINLRDIADYTFGGVFVPIFLFPPIFKTIATILPFRYTLALPLEILNETLTSRDQAIAITIQIAWILFFAISSKILWSRGIKRYSAYGG